jgi:serine/threonine-protein kinase RsbW
VTGDYTLEALAVPESLNLLHELLERAGCDHPDIAEADLMLFETAVIEIAGNVVEHGRPRGNVRWNFSFNVLPERLIGMLSDRGESYEGDVSASQMPGEMDESGRGIVLARMALDELRYERHGGANHWTMRRERR